MNPRLWNDVDQYIVDLLIPSDPVLDSILTSSTAAGLPAINVSPTQGKLLYLLAKLQGAKRILEIGTLGGYSAVWLARALPEGGRLLTIESDPRHAGIARINFATAQVDHLVDLRIGKALDILPGIAANTAEPFDLVFIDADKKSTPEYFAWSLKLTRPGGAIVVDNVIRGGEVTDPTSNDPSVQGVRRFMEMLANEPSVDATAIQTVGSKDYDGFAIALVRSLS
ncbi:MAG: O-methyltransferase [Thermomicrobiales bacterium]|nr:O-methyltransferase [Thermomicrobiales bacterium]